MYKEFSNIYENLIDEDFNYNSLHDFIIKMLNKYDIKRDSMLDSGCGSAKLTSLFKNDFKKITLLDNSEEMLNLAREKFNSINPPLIIKGNSSSFISQSKFDLIISTLDIPNYFKNKKEVESYLHNSYNNLNREGLLIFDISSNKKLDGMSDKIFNIDKENYFHSWENSIRNEENEKYLDITINIFKELRNNRYKRIIEEQSMLYIDDVFIRDVANSLGLNVETFNCYKDELVNEDTEKITFVLKK